MKESVKDYVPVDSESVTHNIGAMGKEMVRLRRASGLYYYRRRIPDDLRAHYGDKEFYVQSLKTKVLVYHKSLLSVEDSEIS